jgi:hypothetical protein
MRKVFIPAFVLVTMLTVSADAQTNRRRTSVPIPAPTATPTSEPIVISRADDFPDEGSQAIPPDPNEVKTSGADRTSIQSLEELGNRIKNLEAAATQNRPKPDPDEKQKRLLLNLDILTKAEQRSESLRKQLFEMMEKETTIRTRIDSLDYDLRPEAIERTTALTGSLRPEELRATRKKSLESEKINLQKLLTEIDKNKVLLEISIQRADSLVERLRTRLEKEIDTELEDYPNKNPNN